MDIIDKIKAHLKQSNTNFVTVEKDGKRLKKNASRNKFLWSENDIDQSFGSIENFLQALPSFGFGNGSILILKTKWENGNYRHRGEIQLKFKDEPKATEAIQPNIITAQNKPTTASTVPSPSQAPASPPIQGMGFTTVQNDAYTDLKIKEQRFLELTAKLEETISKRKDAESELRILKEDKAALQRKFDTLEDKHEIELERIELNRKGFFETEAGKKAMEAMGAALPLLLQKQPEPSLGAPDPNLTNTKKEFVMALANQSVTDDDIVFLDYTLRGLKTVEGFNERLLTLIHEAEIK